MLGGGNDALALVEVEEDLQLVADVHVWSDVALGEEDFLVGSGGSGGAAGWPTRGRRSGGARKGGRTGGAAYYGGKVEAEVNALHDAQGVIVAEF